MSGAHHLGRDQAQVELAGGQIIDNLLVPQNTRDFASYLLKVQQAKPDVVATAVGGDDIKALRQQVSDLKLEDKAAGSTTSRTGPTSGARRRPVRRVRHHLVSQAAAAGRRRVRQALADRLSQVADPGAGQRLLQRLHGDARAARAIERAGSTNNIAVIKQLEGHKMPAADRMQHFDAYIDPDTTRCSRPSIWRAATASRRTTPTFRDPQLDQAGSPSTMPLPANASLPYAEVPSLELRTCRPGPPPTSGARSAFEA